MLMQSSLQLRFLKRKPSMSRNTVGNTAQNKFSLDTFHLPFLDCCMRGNERAQSLSCLFSNLQKESFLLLFFTSKKEASG